MAVDTALIWFRRDLRLHDNPVLVDAARAEALLPVYCFDPREYGTADFGGPDSFRYEKTGGHRAQFRRESVTDLRDSLRAAGSDLLVAHGRPETVLPALVSTTDADAVFFQTLPTSEERTTERAVTARLREEGVAVHRLWTHTLVHLADLPTPYTDIDDTFTPFRKRVESSSTARDPLDVPTLPPLPSATSSTKRATFETLPSLSTLGVENPPVDERRSLDFDGGESAGRDRLAAYLWDHDCLRVYKETRNGLLGADYSSKFSPWLNEGCLSPRFVNAEVDRYEAERVANDSTYWLLFELLWRDFFQFQFLKHGNRFFARGGIRNRTDIEWRTDGEAETAFGRWTAGETGVPFVDATMRELNRTGFVSNRGRQNAASFLANNLRVDWRWGAAYFETQLVDYDPCSNYGNWAYIAGVGNDSRDRYFDVVKQAKQYDEQAAYVTHWLPELAALPPETVHEPWRLSPDEQTQYGVELGVDYPRPVVDVEASYEKLR
ncbi:DASH family cryptochrome [Halogranum rubrum]|uniref:Cryptochrome DASH n=1 Tax=Halogranum salarium B-1 TaxID=1210908 RepID=J3JF62_9EURY|nr:DASH family cryptochrome [Halogranum salarium]EJN58946.1 deoxyribodipyrimidine photolyase [Halogranum salarium B-1]